MVISTYFLFLRIFHFPFSFDSIYFYSGWFWAPIITVIAFSSVGLLRNDYFKISSNAPYNLICNIRKLIFYSLRQFFRCLSNDIALKGLFLHHCVVFSLFCVAIVISEIQTLTTKDCKGPQTNMPEKVGSIKNEK